MKKTGHPHTRGGAAGHPPTGGPRRRKTTGHPHTRGHPETRAAMYRKPLAVPGGCGGTPPNEGRRGNHGGPGWHCVLHPCSMTRPRSALVSLSETLWYHCVSRCVRRACLCGTDGATGRNFEHRRGWIAERIKRLAATFAIDVAAYAVMSNHYHVVVHIDPERSARWSDDEVLRRWRRLFRGPEVVQRHLADAGQLSVAERDQVAQLAAMYRRRLADLSWFMRMLNEPIARRANAEDECSGRFWEGRFRSQALLDERGLLSAMVYVDLNPIRAGLTSTPETSDFTSIQERLGFAPAVHAMGPARRKEQTNKRTASARKATALELGRRNGSSEPPDAVPTTAPLMPFDATGRTAWAIPFGLQEYVELVEWTGRGAHPGKRGQIAPDTPGVLARLGIAHGEFLAASTYALRTFGSAIGAPSEMIRVCAKRQWRFLRGINLARRMFNPAGLSHSTRN